MIRKCSMVVVAVALGSGCIAPAENLGTLDSGVCSGAGQACATLADCCGGFICQLGVCDFVGGPGGGSTSTGASSGGGTAAAATGGGSGTSGGSSGSAGSTSSAASTGSSSAGSSTGVASSAGSSGSSGGSGAGSTGSSGSGTTGSSSSSGGSSSGGSTTGAAVCAEHDASCATEACCQGLTCETHTSVCHVAEGYYCDQGETCAAGLTCGQLPSGGTACLPSGGCAVYLGSCNQAACCSGLTCDPALGPDSEDAGICDTSTTCWPLGYDCTQGGSCCDGLVCDGPTGACLIPPGGSCAGFPEGHIVPNDPSPSPCAGGLACSAAAGYVCTPCATYGGSCASASCCDELACDTTSKVCEVAPGFGCGSPLECANDVTCNTQLGFCQPEGSSCSSYGGTCTTAADCCEGLSCNTQSNGQAQKLCDNGGDYCGIVGVACNETGDCCTGLACCAGDDCTGYAQSGAVCVIPDGGSCAGFFNAFVSACEGSEQCDANAGYVCD